MKDNIKDKANLKKTKGINKINNLNSRFENITNKVKVINTDIKYNKPILIKFQNIK